MFLGEIITKEGRFFIQPINHAEELYNVSPLSYKDRIDNVKEMARLLGYVIYTDCYMPMDWNGSSSERKATIVRAIKEEKIDSLVRAYYKDIKRRCKETININGKSYTGRDLYELGFDTTPYTMQEIERKYQHELHYQPSLKNKDIVTLMEFYILGVHYGYNILRGLEL